MPDLPGGVQLAIRIPDLVLDPGTPDTSGEDQGAGPEDRRSSPESPGLQGSCGRLPPAQQPEAAQGEEKLPSHDAAKSYQASSQDGGDINIGDTTSSQNKLCEEETNPWRKTTSTTKPRRTPERPATSRPVLPGRSTPGARLAGRSRRKESAKTKGETAEKTPGAALLSAALNIKNSSKAKDPKVPEPKEVPEPKNKDPSEERAGWGSHRGAAVAASERFTAAQKERLAAERQARAGRRLVAAGNEQKRVPHSREEGIISAPTSPRSARSARSRSPGTTVYPSPPPSQRAVLEPQRPGTSPPAFRGGKAFGAKEAFGCGGRRPKAVAEGAKKISAGASSSPSLPPVEGSSDSPRAGGESAEGEECRRRERKKDEEGRGTSAGKERVITSTAVPSGCTSNCSSSALPNNTNPRLPSANFTAQGKLAEEKSDKTRKSEGRRPKSAAAGRSAGTSCLEGVVEQLRAQNARLLQENKKLVLLVLQFSREETN